MKCTKEEFCAALAAEGAIVADNYLAGLPATQEWFTNRAGCHPWNNPLCKSDIHAVYATPNCDKTMASDFRFFTFESYGEKEADMLMEAFRKVSEYYAK